MNSLSYLSRQYDVLASASVPNTPPSTPTDEHCPPTDANDVRPQLKRIQTWASARSFLFPTLPQAQKHLQRSAPPPVHARRRSGSTPNSSRLQLAVPAPPLASVSVGDAMPAAAASESASALAQPPASMPSIQPKSRPPELSWVRRVFFVRVLFLFSNWLGAVWDGFIRSLRHAPGRDAKPAREAEAETSGDEKDSDSDTVITFGTRLRVKSARRVSYVKARASSIVNIVLQPQVKPPTPSPLSQSIVAPLPAVNLIPPDPSDSDDGRQSSSPSLAAPSSQLRSTLLPRTSPHSRGTQSSNASSSPPAKTTPLHTRKTLVLDLDETLIHSTTRPLFPSGGSSGFLNFGNLIGFGRNRKAGHMVEVVMGGRSTLYHVYKRPFVDYFLRKVSTWYTLVIFTASMKEYADPVIDWLDAGRGILALRFFREHCTQLPNGAYSKDLSILNEDLARICLIDNSPVSYSINQANGIPIEGWTYDPNDEALLDLLPVLDSLRFTSDVRHILGLRGF